MKKKLFAITIAIVMVFALAACNNTPAPAPAPDPAPAPTAPADPAPADTGDQAWDPANIGEHSFILAHGLPGEGMTGLQYHEFALAVDKLSEGKMKIDERIGGTLVTDTETLDALMNGTVDFIHSMGSYASGTVTDISPLTIAGYYGGSDWLSFITDTHDLIEDIYADYGIKYMGGLYQGNTAIVCTEKQVKEPGDVKGLAFRASGTWVSKTVEAWGGAATTIGLADLADAFSKKTVQGCATGWNIIVPFKIYESTKYITTTTISEGFAALLMNGDTWDSLNADEQALLTEAAKIFEVRSLELATDFMGTYRAEVEDSGLCELYDLSAAEQQQFIDLAYGLFPEMEPELGDKGMQLVSLLKQINGIS